MPIKQLQLKKIPSTAQSLSDDLFVPIQRIGNALNACQAICQTLNPQSKEIQDQEALKLMGVFKMMQEVFNDTGSKSLYKAQGICACHSLGGQMIKDYDKITKDKEHIMKHIDGDKPVSKLNSKSPYKKIYATYYALFKTKEQWDLAQNDEDEATTNDDDDDIDDKLNEDLNEFICAVRDDTIKISPSCGAYTKYRVPFNLHKIYDRLPHPGYTDKTAESLFGSIKRHADACFLEIVQVLVEKIKDIPSVKEDIKSVKDMSPSEICNYPPFIEYSKKDGTQDSSLFIRELENLDINNSAIYETYIKTGATYAINIDGIAYTIASKFSAAQEVMKRLADYGKYQEAQEVISRLTAYEEYQEAQEVMKKLKVYEEYQKVQEPSNLQDPPTSPTQQEISKASTLLSSLNSAPISPTQQEISKANTLLSSSNSAPISPTQQEIFDAKTLLASSNRDVFKDARVRVLKLISGNYGRFKKAQYSINAVIAQMVNRRRGF